MVDQVAANLAVERAWRVYRLMNSGIHERDERRATLERFIRMRCEAGEEEVESMVVAGLKHLKKLDEFGDGSSR
jgi:hypothetical protein